MDTHQSNDREIKTEAQRINTMLNSLSLFTRKTMLEWLPELESQMGITGERFMVMFELVLQPDRSLKELAHTLVISPSSLSVMINSMVEQGVVSRITDPADRRRVLLRLSDKGNTLFQTADSHILERFQGFLTSLEEKDRQDLNEATVKMLQVMDRILERPAGEDQPQRKDF